MPARLTRVLVWWARRLGAALSVMLALSRFASGQSMQSVLMQPNSGITIQVTNIYNGMPARGFLPLRVEITNSSNNDGQWSIETQVLAGNGADGHLGTQATCAVQAHATRVFEILAPLPDSTPENPPHVNVRVTGPGVVNPDTAFLSNIQQPPPNALRVQVPVSTSAFSGSTTIRSGGRGGSVRLSTDSSGNSTRTTTTIQPDGSTTTEVITTRNDGSSQTTTTTTDSTGRIIFSSSGGSPAPRGGARAGAPPPTAPPPPLPPAGAYTPSSLNVGSGGTLTLGNGGTITINGNTMTLSGVLQNTASLPGDKVSIASSTDPLSGAKVTITTTKHADGTTTTVTSTPTKMGTDIVTETTDANGVKKGTSHELQLSPQAMDMVVPSSASTPALLPNTLVVGGTGMVQASPANATQTKTTSGALVIGAPNTLGGSMIVSSGNLSIQLSTPFGAGNVTLGGGNSPSSTVTISNPGLLAQTAPASAAGSARRAPPPPPPPPPPASLGRAGAAGTAGRGSRGGYRIVTRSVGAPIFIGLSPTLSNNQGEKIKNYYLTACVRPIQQSALDPTLLSADWRAYLGFDLVFYTAADWLAAPPEIRTALVQWVAAGGELRLIANQDGGLNLPPRQGEHYGAGAIELFTEDELNNYDFTLEHTEPSARALFSLVYHPAALLELAQTIPSYDVPGGMQSREFTLGEDTAMRLVGVDPYAGSGSSNAVTLAETMLTDLLSRSGGATFSGGASVHINPTTRHVTVINTPSNLELINNLMTRYGEASVGTPAAGSLTQLGAGNMTLPVATGAPKPGEAKTEADAPKFMNEMPHLRNRYFVVAMVIICFGLLAGPLNLFWFCGGSRRPHLLWVTPLLAILASVAILGFILLAEGIGGRGIYYRITQLNPDGKFAVESEVESSVTGLLTRHDFDLGELAWVLDYNQATPDNPIWPHGNFLQTGKHYTGDWFASRREQMLFARAVVPSRASLRAEPAAEGKPPVLHSEHNGLLVDLFYVDGDGHYWKTDRITEGQPTHLQPATPEEFATAWSDNVRSAPEMLSSYLRKITPQPGTFFALGSGEASPLEPDFTGLRWNRFRHVITGPVAE